MNCEEIWESSSALCSGELSPEEIQQILAHTEECEQCRVWLGTMRNVWEVLDCWTVVSPPKNCVESFRNRLAQVSGQTSPPKKNWKFWETRQFSGPGFLVPGLAFVMIMGLLAAVLTVNHYKTGGTIGASRSVAEGSSNQGDRLASTDTIDAETELASAETDGDGYNLLPESLKHAGPLSRTSQESVGVILVSDWPNQDIRNRARISPDVLKVVPAGHTH